MIVFSWRFYRLLATKITIFACLNLQATAAPTPRIPGTIKVLIAEHANKPHDYDLRSPSLLTITNEKGVSFIQKSDEKLLLSIKRNTAAVHLNSKKKRSLHGDTLIIGNSEQHFILNDKEYRGKIIIHTNQEKKKTYVINELALEDYVCSVLRSECIPYWPLEIQKVQAVASRSYAAYHIYLNKKNIRPYDIRNCTLNQIYDGHHTMKRLHQAVQETANQIMVYDNKPVLAMFDVCCGGVVPANLALIDSRKPYLYRPYACTHCEESSSYRWTIDIHTQDFINSLQKLPHLKKQLRRLGGLINIDCTRHEPSDVVTAVTIQGSRKCVELAPRDIKQAFNAKIKSPAFSITKKKDRIFLEGKGFGHYHGLCQCGARNLVKKGWLFKRILRFYYPQVSFARLRA